MQAEAQDDILGLQAAPLRDVGEPERSDRAAVMHARAAADSDRRLPEEERDGAVAGVTPRGYLRPR